jgi:hypothetical protein
MKHHFTQLGWQLFKNINSHPPVAHACNSNYSGGRDQEVHNLKPAQASSLRDAILKKPITKKDR